jgi:hypothetical protein
MLKLVKYQLDNHFSKWDFKTVPLIVSNLRLCSSLIKIKLESVKEFDVTQIKNCLIRHQNR